MAENKPIGLLFGVSGGGSISGASGTKIKNQLANIIGQINKSDVVKLSFKIDPVSKQNLEKELKGIAKDIKVSATSSGGTTTTKFSTDDARKVKTEADLRIKEEQRLAAEAKKNAALEEQRYKAASHARMEAKRAAQDLEEAQKREQAASKKSINLDVQRLNLLKQVQSYYGKYGDSISSSPEIDQKFQSLIAKLKDPDSYDDIQKARKDLKELTFETKNAGLEVEKTSSKFSKLFSEHLNTAIALVGVHFLQNTLRTIYRNVVEIDTAMTELRKVTDETDDTYNKFLNSAATTAKQLGANISDVVNATADFARLGYNIGDASVLANAAIVYKHVGDGISNVSEASESIISTMKAFGIAASDAMRIVDIYNEIGNKFAISSEGVGTALQKSSSALAVAGNTLEESAAMAAGMNAVVQNPEIVGTALKTYSMYLRAAKVEAEEAGEETDGMAESVSKLRESILKLTSGKVDIQIDENNFKSVYQISSEIASVWDDLQDVDRSALLELIGGKRNANSLSSLFTNWADVEKALVVAQNASGSALAENDKYLNSIQGKLSQTEAIIQSISQNVLNSKIVKVVLNVMNGLLKIVDLLSKIPGLLPTIAAGVATIAVTYKGMRENLSAVNNYLEGFNNAIRNSKSISSEQIEGLTNAYARLTKEQRGIVKNFAKSNKGNDGLRSIINTYEEGIIATKQYTKESLKASLATANLTTKEQSNIMFMAQGIIKQNQASSGLDTLTLKQILNSNAINENTKARIRNALATQENVEAMGKQVNMFDLYAMNIKQTFSDAFQYFTSNPTGQAIGLAAIGVIVARIGAAIADATTLSTAELKESYNSSKEKLSEYENSLSEIESQIEKNKEAIKDYTLLQTDTSAIRVLEEENAELEKQYSLYKSLIEQQKLKTANDASAIIGNKGVQADVSKAFEYFENGDYGKLLTDSLSYGLPGLIKNAKRIFTGEFDASSTWDWLDLSASLIPATGAITQFIPHSDEKNDIIKQSYKEIEKIQELYKARQQFYDELELYTQAEQLDPTNQWVTDSKEYTLSVIKDTEEQITNLTSALGTSFAEIEEYKRALMQLTNKDGTFIFQEDIDKINALEDALVRLDASKPEYNTLDKIFQSEKYGAYTSDLIELAKTGEFTAEKLESDFHPFYVLITELGIPVDELKEKLLGLGKGDYFDGRTLSDFKETTEALQNTEEILATAQKEMASGEGVSADTIQKMAGVTSNYLDYLKEENGVVTLLTDKWKEYSRSVMQSDIDYIKDKLEVLPTTIQKVKDALSLAEASGDESAIAGYKAQLEALEDEFDSYSSMLPIYLSVFNQIGNAAEDMSNAFSETSSSIKTMSDAFAEQNSSGGLSLDTMMKVIDAGYAAALSIDAETGAVRIDTEAFIALAQAKITQQIASLRAQAASAEASLSAEARAALVDAAAFAKLAAAKKLSDVDISTINSIKTLRLEAEALESIDLSQVAQGIYNIGSAASSASSQLSNAKSAIDSLVSSVVTIIKKDIQDQIDGLNDAKKASQDRYTAEKEAAQDAWNAKKKYFDDEKDKLKDLEDAYSKIIKARKDALKDEKDENDYNKQLQEKQQEIAELENSILEISNDTSAEGTKKRLELEEELAEKRSDLEDFQADHAYDTAVDALDDELQRYQDVIDTKIDLIEKQSNAAQEAYNQQIEWIERQKEADAAYYENKISALQDYMSQEGLLRQEAMQQITDNINNTDLKTNALYQKLIEWNRKYGTGIDEDVYTAWMDAYNAMQQYGGSQQDVYQTLSYLTLEMWRLADAVGAAAANAMQLSSALNNASTSRVYNGNLKRYVGMSEDQIRYEIKSLKANGGSGYSNEISELERWLAGLNAYHTGTSNVGEADGIQTFSDLYDGLKNNEVIAKLEKGEAVLSKSDKRRFTDTFAYLIGRLKSGEFSDSIRSYFSNLPDITGSVFDSYSPADYSKYLSSGEPAVNMVFNVEGNLDKSVLPDIERIVKSAMSNPDTMEKYTRHTMDTIVKNSRNRGLSRNAKFAIV